MQIDKANLLDACVAVLLVAVGLWVAWKWGWPIYQY